VVDIADVSGHYHSCRVVLDPGTQSNFISEHFCNKLKLHKIPVNIPIKGIGETLSHVRYSIKATIKSRNSAFTLQFSCLVISKLTDVLLSRVIDRKVLDILNNLRLTDPQFDQSAQIDMFIRAEYFLSSIMRGSNQVKFRLDHSTKN